MFPSTWSRRRACKSASNRFGTAGWLLAVAALALGAGPAAAQPNIGFKEVFVTVKENAGSVKVEVVLDASSSSTVTVQYMTQDGMSSPANSPKD